VGRLVIVITSLAVAGVLASAAQARPAVTRSAFVTASASWSTTKQLAGGDSRRTEWYVDVSQGRGEESNSFLARLVMRCHGTGDAQQCRNTSMLAGPGDVSGQAFALNPARRMTARVDATYNLKPYDVQGHPLGPPRLTRFVARWNGTGRIDRARDIESHRDRCEFSRSVTVTDTQPAQARATVGGKVLGKSSAASVGVGRRTGAERHTC
jgi:hypothetical protein